MDSLNTSNAGFIQAPFSENESLFSSSHCFVVKIVLWYYIIDEASIWFRCNTYILSIKIL